MSKRPSLRTANEAKLPKTKKQRSGLSGQGQKHKKPKAKDQEELDLEKHLFGESETNFFGLSDDEEEKQLSQLQQQLNNNSGKVSKKQKQAAMVELGLFVDKAGDNEDEENEDEDDEEEDVNTAKVFTESKGPQAAWVDEDDENVVVDLSQVNKLRKLRTSEKEDKISGKEYTERLRKKFNELNPATAWAVIPEEEKSSEEEASLQALLRSSSGLVTSSSSSSSVGVKLPQGLLEVTRMKDANVADVSKAVVQVSRFHPNGQLLLTAGLDKTLRLFQVDGVRNPKVQGVHLPDMPIFSADFVNNGAEIVASGRRKYFYSYDLQAGKVTKIPGIRGRDEKSLETMAVSPDGQWLAFAGNSGYIILVSNRTKQWVANMKQNGQVRSLSFAADSKSIFSITSEGQLYIWDVSSRRCLYRHADEGAVKGTCVTVSKDGRYYAAGSDSGVVNVYSTSNLYNGDFKPLKSIMNLTTSIDSIVFNHDAQMMAISSRLNKDSLRMVHVPSLTTFSNWPTSQTPLHYVSSVDFSPNSGFFAIGNDRGRVLLYRATHYQSA